MHISRYSQKVVQQKLTTGTTHPPLIPSVAARGEWSIGKILELYWQFGDAGDCYAGRILAGLDQHVAEAMQLCFGSILDGQNGIDWLLLLLLASLVHHSKFLQGMKDSVPNHPFLANIPIFCGPPLLVELKKVVIMKPSNCIPNATGLPPHVKSRSWLC
jgi:hypothetical protein